MPLLSIPRNNPDTRPNAPGIRPIQATVILPASRNAQWLGASRGTLRNTGNGTAVMNGKNDKLASAVLSALLYTQVGLCLIAVTFAVLKDRPHAGPVVVAAMQTLDTSVN